MDSFNNEETAGFKTTLFNAGVAKLMRINDIKKQLHLCRAFDNEQLRRRWLGSYHSEINQKLNQEERERCLVFEENLDAFLKNKGKKLSFDITFLDKMLDDYELYLGDLEDKYGFSMPDKDDDDGL